MAADTLGKLNYNNCEALEGVLLSKMYYYCFKQIVYK